MNEGFILIHRKIIKDWEWYSNVNDRLVWLHCLLSANWKDGWFEGKKIPRGSFATSYQKLADEIGITIRQVRTSLEHLKMTNNLTIDTNHQFSIITINNYNKYQLEANELTNDWQTIGKRLTNERQTIDNNRININKEIKEINKETISNDIVKKVEKKYFESLKVNTIFNEFLDLRKKLKAVNSDRAINMLINKLNEYDEETQYEMIEQSIVNSWKGIFELKNKSKKRDNVLDTLREIYNNEKNGNN